MNFCKQGLSRKKIMIVSFGHWQYCTNHLKNAQDLVEFSVAGHFWPTVGQKLKKVNREIK